MPNIISLPVSTVCGALFVILLSGSTLLAYEIQLIDQPLEVSEKGNMSIYRHFVPSSNPQKPHDQWIAFEITA